MIDPAVVHQTPRVPPRADPWWRGAVIYQIYPRSFADSNGDGVGDLPGITAHLDHVARLGVDAIWISPFFKSPMKDFGYDIADYCEVDPLFGTLADFDVLLARAHEFGLKLLIDFVPSHTSDAHPWFLESRADRDNPKTDWYVWADAKPDGMPPNNWVSVFGGVSWEWEPRRRQYYLHNFLKEQPDLNFRNPAVVEALLGVATFWLERGVDGFRVDAIEFGVHDAELRDNPPRPPGTRFIHGAPGSPFSMQMQRFNKAQLELNDLFLKPLHRLTDRYGAKALVGEVTGDRALERIAGHTQGGGLDMAYGFELLTGQVSAPMVRGYVEEMEGHLGDGWVTWSFSNHDAVRGVSRLGMAQPSDSARLLLPILLCSLRGSPCIYQGEELGLEEAELAYEELQDPFGIAFWPDTKGRDGCRTPMPWTADRPHGGFTEGRPWLPVPKSHLARAVDRQAADQGSTLQGFARFLAWRREQPTLRAGDIRFFDAGEAILAFGRELGDAQLTCAFNLTADPATVAISGPPASLAYASQGAHLKDMTIELPAYGFAFAARDKGD